MKKNFHPIWFFLFFIQFHQSWQQDILRAQEQYLPPFCDEAPFVSIVIDDVAYLSPTLSLILNSEMPLTLAILPHEKASAKIATLAQEKGVDYILHQPMASVGNSFAQTQGLITGDMETQEIYDICQGSVDSLGTLPVGMNNHMGSEITAKAHAIRPVLSFLRDKKMFFLDSMTTGASVAEKVAEEVGTFYMKRDVFLDNIMTREHLEAQFQALMAKAWKNGRAIGIMHCKKLSAEVIIDLMRERKDIRFISLSEMARLVKDASYGKKTEITKEMPRGDKTEFINNLPGQKINWK